MANKVPQSEMKSVITARPTVLGPNFAPQSNQYLSVNTHHGTPNSEEGSNLSSSASSPRRSPYQSSGQRTPSPNRKGESHTNICPNCGKTFSSTSALAKHKLIHSDERKYVCHICSRGFKRQDHLNGHMVTHRDKKPYECPRTECGKSYCDMRSLRRHVENQHGSPPGGSTPGSMPHLTPFGGYKSDMNSNQSFYQSMPHLTPFG